MENSTSRSLRPCIKLRILRRAFLLDPREALLEVGGHDLGVGVKQPFHRRLAAGRLAGQDIGGGLNDAVDILLPVPGP